ncbi:MAG: hypothetical protein KDN22_17375 [Verrucomicrobiae bacterium]|nr:hypothetical protein [Verrucomicrobiae bacterium]
MKHIPWAYHLLVEELLGQVFGIVGALATVADVLADGLPVGRTEGIEGDPRRLWIVSSKLPHGAPVRVGKQVGFGGGLVRQLADR